MQKLRLTHDLILEKSKKTGIPFSDILGGAVLEEIVRRIGVSEYKENLWLKNGNVLGEAQYQKKLTLTLEYVYVLFKISKKDADKTDDMFLSELFLGLEEKSFGSHEDYGIAFRASYKIYKKNMQIQFVASLGDMQVPVSVKVLLLRDNEKIPKKESLSCMMFPKASLLYNSYPAESVLAECYVEIISKLELIQNIGAYYDIYHLLENESVDGRKVKEYIEEGCEQLHIRKEKDRLDMIQGYKNYSYMKKRWKVFLRGINSKEPSWETALERFMSFFEPIWKAIMEDLVFFGDWMPDLDRFL